jgi:GntR family transcriptional regulator/MocR family aminotransferase
VDLHVDLGAAPGRSLRARCEHALRAAVRRMPAGTRLPPTRALAAELGVSRGVVVEAYAQLAAEGYLLTRHGGGTFVAGEWGGAIVAPGGGAAPSREGAAAHGPAATAAPTTRALPRPPRYDLRPALPALDGAFRPGWARALGRALRTTADARFGYPDRRGEPELREALASSLARRRGVQATAAEVLVTGGLGPSLPFVWRLLAERGIRRVAIEDPCWPRLEATLVRAGLEPVRVAVDADGVDTHALDRLDVDAIFVTPAHQYPTGAVLSPARRAALIDWARNPNPQGGLIPSSVDPRRGQTPSRVVERFVIEDDYDAEFRYDRQPVGSLQGLAPDVVIYGGSTSKTLAPGLRLGWLVLPPGIETDAPAPPPVLDQLALADLITRGDFDRHLRRHRRLYQRRREALLDALAERLPDLAVSGAAAGLHFVLHLPPRSSEAATVEAARAQGIALDPLRATKPGLVVGYANLPEALAPAAVEALAATLE